MMKNETFTPWLSLQGAAGLVKKSACEGDDEASRFLIQAAENIAETSSKVSTAVQTILGNEMGSTLSNIQAARKAIAQLVAPALKKTDAAVNFAHAGIASLEKRSSPKMPDDVAGALLHQEVRSALSKMSLAQRNAAINNSIAAGDESFLAAATSGSPVLSGMSADEQKAAKERWRRERHSDDAAKIAGLTNGVAQLTRIKDIFVKWSSGLIDEPNAQVLATAEETAARARAASS